MIKKITLKSIASELGVSPSTVSKAMKNSHEISEETRKKIQTYAKFYNYKPNSLALGLQSQKTMVIGVILPEIVHHFFSKVINGIESIASENNYNLMICLSKDNFKKEVQNVEMLSNGSVDGLLVSVAKETLEKANFQHFYQLIEEGFPVVFLDRAPPDISIDKVTVDDAAGGYKAAMHLIEKGYKKLAVITTPKHITVGLNRERGFLKALKEVGLPVFPYFDIKVNESKAIRPQIEKLFLQEHLPDGIFAVNEIYAAMALKIAQKRGLKIPEDIAIMGFTDGFISKVTTPSLTTVAQHGHTMGMQATEVLLKRICKKQNTKSYQNIVISTNVVERESTIGILHLEFGFGNR